MRRVIVATLSATLVLGAMGGAALAKGKTQRSWEAVACTSSTKSKATKCQQALASKGINGYSIETEEGKAKSYEVAKEGFTKSSVKTEVDSLKTAGFKYAHAEQEEAA
jgi:hypothetical protein